MSRGPVFAQRIRNLRGEIRQAAVPNQKEVFFIRNSS